MQTASSSLPPHPLEFGHFWPHLSHAVHSVNPSRTNPHLRLPLRATSGCAFWIVIFRRTPGMLDRAARSGSSCLAPHSHSANLDWAPFAMQRVHLHHRHLQRMLCSNCLAISSQLISTCFLFSIVTLIILTSRVLSAATLHLRVHWHPDEVNPAPRFCAWSSVSFPQIRVVAGSRAAWFLDEGSSARGTVCLAPKSSPTKKTAGLFVRSRIATAAQPHRWSSTVDVCWPPIPSTWKSLHVAQAVSSGLSTVHGSSIGGRIGIQLLGINPSVQKSSFFRLLSVASLTNPCELRVHSSSISRFARHCQMWWNLLYGSS